MKVSLHQTHHTIAAFGSIKQYLVDNFVSKKSEGLHLFPELFLTGYPLQDLCLQNSFITRYQAFLEDISELSTQIMAPNDNLLLLGGLQYIYDEKSGIPKRIENVIYELRPGSRLKAVYSKILLPNYDIFDEKKYFFPGERPAVINFLGKNIGLLICEDMWPSTYHEKDPTELLLATGIQCDLVVNLSASPYNLHKQEKRIQRALEISQTLKASFAYVNRVGVEDEIIFDGGSFLINGDTCVTQARSFQAEIITEKMPAYFCSHPGIIKKDLENTWENLFAPDIIIQKDTVPTLRPLTDQDCQELIEALGFGVQEYADKSGFKKFLLAFSGGIDSALVLAIMKINLREGQELEAIYMPSKFSRPISLELSEEMCQKAGILLHQFPIEELHSKCQSLFLEHMKVPLEGLADENIQSRLRGNLLYARSNQTGAMVINTSNKSEIAVGYSTLYGDSVGALSLLGDLYKTEVYTLARFINRQYKGLIPAGIITRAPSAELREGQEDSDSLPPYARLDPMLEGILSYRLNADQLINLGFAREEVIKTIELYRKVEYKRAQFCPILKVKSKSFGLGYRVPINKDSSFYLPKK